MLQPERGRESRLALSVRALGSTLIRTARSANQYTKNVRYRKYTYRTQLVRRVSSSSATAPAFLFRYRPTLETHSPATASARYATSADETASENITTAPNQPVPTIDPRNITPYRPAKNISIVQRTMCNTASRTSLATFQLKYIKAAQMRVTGTAILNMAQELSGSMFEKYIIPDPAATGPAMTSTGTAITVNIPATA